MFLAYIYKNFAISRLRGLAIFIFGIFLLLVSISSKASELELHRVLLWGIPSFFIVFGLLYCPQIKTPLFKYLGDASYSIYLVQMLTISAFYKLSSKVLSGWNGDVLALLCLIF